MALEARVRVRLGDLSKPTTIRTRTLSLSPGQQSIVLDLEGHYLFNFRLLCNPLLTERGWNIAQNQMATASLVIDDVCISNTDIIDMPPSCNISAWYQTSLDFLDSPILVETLSRSNVRIDISYIAASARARQVCYLMYDVGYHNNNQQNRVLTSGVTPVCYTVKSKYQNGYHFIGLTTLGGKMVK